MTITAVNDVDTEAEEPPRRRTWVWVAGSAAAFAVGGWLLLGSPLLSVDSVEVEGYPGAAEKVTAAAGVSAGTSLLLLNPTAVAQRVSELEDVAAATVSRRWPDTVVITVDPERTVAYSQGPDGVYLRGGTGGEVAVVEQPPQGLPEVGPMPEVQVADALSLLSSLPPETLAAVARVDFTEDSGYTLTLRDGRGSVVWGQSQEALLKSTVLGAMMRVDDTATWFDLTNPRAPRAAAVPPQDVPGASTGEGTEVPNLESPEGQPGQSVDAEGSAERSVGLRPAG